MALAAIAGIAAIGSLLTQMSPSKGYYDYVRDQFVTAHSTWPIDVTKSGRIDGVGYPYGTKNIGFPSRKNALRNYWTYPNAETSKLINKDKRNWEVVFANILDKDKQLDMIELKMNCDDPWLLWPHKKQSNRNNYNPKILFKPGIIKNLTQ